MACYVGAALLPVAQVPLHRKYGIAAVGSGLAGLGVEFLGRLGQVEAPSASGQVDGDAAHIGEVDSLQDHLGGTVSGARADDSAGASLDVRQPHAVSVHFNDTGVKGALAGGGLKR